MSDASVSHHDVVSVADAIGAAARALATTGAAKLSQHPFDGMPAESGETSSTTMQPTRASRGETLRLMTHERRGAQEGKGRLGKLLQRLGKLLPPPRFWCPCRLG